MARGKKSGAKEIEMEQRRAQALELRKAGASLRAIGERLGVSHVTVMEDINAALAATRDENAKAAEELRALEIDVLDGMYLAIATQIRAGHLGAIDRGLRIRERRAKLLGLDAPVKQDVTSGGDKITFAFVEVPSPDGT